nr:hypothetical protein [Paenibacillus timonensis]
MIVVNWGLLFITLPYQKLWGAQTNYFAGTPTCIRRRKLSCAAYDIQNTDEKIIDIAMRYGYFISGRFYRVLQAKRINKKKADRCPRSAFPARLDVPYAAFARLSLSFRRARDPE